MRIDERIERQVRNTLHWAVKQKSAEFDSALQGFSDEGSRLAALELLTYICVYTATDVFGHKPSAEEIEALALEVARHEEWSSLTAAEVEAFLKAIIHDTHTHHLDPERYVLLSFVVAASLLSSKPRAEGEWWFDYLDQVEEAIEASSSKKVY